MLALLTIARNALIESLRQPIVLVMVLLSGVLQYLTTASTAYSMGYRNVPGEVTGDDKLLFDVGLGSVFVCGILLAAFVATAAVSREIENKTVLTVVSKPIGRTTVVLGKFLGILTTMAVASAIMVLYLMFALRHGVLSTVADDIDQPVVLFSTAATFLAVGFAAVMNFLYGRNFAQTAVLSLLPLLLVGYALTLPFDHEWKVQAFTKDLKPQVLMACAGTATALMVLSAVAVAASTRLGQVMTIVVTAGVFMLGLLSNHFIGSRAFLNVPIGVIESVAPLRPQDEGLLEVGSGVTVTLEQPPEVEVVPGAGFYFGPAPNGLGMVTPRAYEPIPAGLDLTRSVYPAGTPSALVITAVDGRVLTVRQIGERPVRLDRAPDVGDSAFLEPARVAWPAAVAWSLIPNMHAFWMVDAVTQVRPIPLSHLALVLGYGLAQAAASLCVAVLLFEGREVG